MKSDELLNEEWKDVPGYEDLYEISKSGLCWSKISHQLLALSINSNGYPVYVSSIGRKTIHFYVHRVLAQLWIPNPENKSDVNHIDGIKTNFSLSNLEWATRSENLRHAINNGLKSTKLTREIVDYCREVYIPRHKEYSAANLARTFGVTKLAMHNAISGKTWK